MTAESMARTSARGASPRTKRNRWKKQILRRVSYVFARALHAGVCRIPFRLSGAASWCIGNAAHLFLIRDRRRAHSSLLRVFGQERSAREIRSLVRRVFRHSASVYVEWSILRRWPEPRLRATFPLIAEDLCKLRAEIASSGSGVVGLTAHLGNWELLSLFFGRFTPGLLVPVANRIYYPRYHEFLYRLRIETGLKVLYNDESARKAIQAIRDGHILGLLPDHEVRTNSSTFVDFLGLPAQTATFPVQLARKLQVKMAMVLLVRDGSTYRVINCGLFDAPHTEDEAEDLRNGTARWSQMLEVEIRRYPDQWSWTHDRWRSTPDHPRRHLDRGRRMG